MIYDSLFDGKKPVSFNCEKFEVENDEIWIVMRLDKKLLRLPKKSVKKIEIKL